MAKRRHDKDVAAAQEPERDEWGEEGARPGEDDGGDEEPRPPRRRRTLAEAAAESENPAAGVRCPVCGCGHTRVAKTWDVDSGRRRRRICRACGTEFPTTER